VSAQSAVLRDGTIVGLRSMQDDDGERLVRFHSTLSPETQYLRFFSGHARLSAHEVEWFTHVDHSDREAIVATIEDEIVAVGRLDRLANRNEAEVAFVVTDRLQGKGLGGVLLRQLVARAGELGIERFVAETLAHNERMLAVFHHAGLPVTSRFSEGVVHVTLDLPAAGVPR
jgi:RimJ/RimL family protein N-acetyltransferase